MDADGKRKDFEDFREALLNISDVSGLETELGGKAPAAHDHTQAEVLGLGVALGAKAAAVHTHDFVDLPDAPSSYTGEGLSILRVNAAETGLEFIPPSSLLSSGSIEVGDLITKLKRRPDAVTGPNQYLPAWEPATVDAAEWPDLQPVLYGVKAEVLESNTDQFLAVSVSRSSGIAKITLANTDECQMLCDLLRADLAYQSYNPTSDTSSNDYAAWGMTIDLPGAIDFIPAGRYQLTNVDLTNRELSFALAGANQGATPVTEYVECWPNRIAGTSSVCVWRAITDASLTMGRIPGLRNLDSNRKHLLGSYSAGGGMDYVYYSQEWYTRTRALSAFIYIFAGTKL